MLPNIKKRKPNRLLQTIPLASQRASTFENPDFLSQHARPLSVMARCDFEQVDSFVITLSLSRQHQSLFLETSIRCCGMRLSDRKCFGDSDLILAATRSNAYSCTQHVLLFSWWRPCCTGCRLSEQRVMSLLAASLLILHCFWRRTNQRRFVCWQYLSIKM